jgi:hypothetical protein
MWLVTDFISFDARSFSDQLGLPYFLVCQTGTEALHVAMAVKLALEGPRDDPVLVSGLNCTAVTSLAERSAGRVLLYAPDSSDLVSRPRADLAAPSLGEHENEVAVHFGASLSGGHWTDKPDRIQIEDCCQAPECFHLAQKRQGHAHVAVFSFRGGKPYSWQHGHSRDETCVNGLLATNSADILQLAAARLWRKQMPSADRLAEPVGSRAGLPTGMLRCGWSRVQIDFLCQGLAQLDSVRVVGSSEEGVRYFVPLIATAPLVAERLWVALSCEGYPVKLSHIRPAGQPVVNWSSPQDAYRCIELNGRLLLLFAEPTPGKSLESFVEAVCRVIGNLDAYAKACFSFRAAGTRYMLRRNSQLQWILIRSGDRMASVLSEAAASRLISRLECDQDA